MSKQSILELMTIAGIIAIIAILAANFMSGGNPESFADIIANCESLAAAIGEALAAS